MVAASAVVALLLWRVALNQGGTVTVGAHTIPADSVGSALRGSDGLPALLDLNDDPSRAGLDRALARAVPDTTDRVVVVEAVLRRIARGPALRNVGELARLDPAPDVVAEFVVQPASSADPSRSVHVPSDTSGGVPATSVVGRVTNLAGDGLAGIVVERRGPGGTETDQTDVGGRFAFEGLAEGGAHVVRPRYRGFVFEPQGIPAGDGPRVDSLVVETGASVTFVGRRYPTAQLAAGLGRVKPGLIVRTPDGFRSLLWRSALWFFGAFYVVHLVWRYAPGARGRGGRDPLFLPLVHLLAGIGLALMVGVRDPLRDQALFADFVGGAVLACAALAIAGVIPVQRWLRPRAVHVGGWTLPREAVLWAPIALAAALFVLLTVFGAGPEGSDAKVNLWGVQPSEAIKVLVVLGLAGLLDRYHDRLRTLRQRFVTVAGRRVRTGALGLPRGRDVGLLAVVVGAAGLMFFLQRDMGPALILAATALGLYGVARRDVVVPALGFGGIAAGFWAIYQHGGASTATTRLTMMASPWDNFLTNGVQLAEAHWALATGGVWGLGLGNGSPRLIPAGHTDMVLAGLGEEIGLLGLLCVGALYGVLVWRGLRAALAARGPYGMFLGVGLTLLLAFQLLLIGGGVLGLLPLSGVVTPFVSYGRTSMVFNGAVVGFLAAISAGGVRPKFNDLTRPYRWPVRVLGTALAVVGLVYAGRLVDLQALRADEIAVRPALVRLGDGSRSFVYNGRVLQAVRDIPRGTITDRNGLVLATSDCDEVVAQDSLFRAAGLGTVVDPGALCADERDRYYPLGAHTFYLLGDRETRLYQADESRTTPFTFVEFDPETNARLQGYDDGYERVLVLQEPDDTEGVLRDRRDFSAVLPLMRSPGNRSAAARALLGRDRDVRLALDARIQVAAGEALERMNRGRRMNSDRPLAAATVVDPATGEILAAATSPVPYEAVDDPESVAFDGEMRERAFSWKMAPASSFKALLAMAALRRDPTAMERAYPCGQGGGPVRMDVALIRSCNEYFKRLAVEAVGQSGVHEAIGRFGIQDGGVDDPPSSLDQLGIGQGRLLASTSDMAGVAATVAAGGVHRPLTFLARPPEDRAERFLGAREAAWLSGSMRRVVTEGTARAADGGVPAAGKTGTGQYRVGGRNVNRAWFIGFAPYGTGAPPLAVAVVVDAYRGGGGAVAAPQAVAILDEALRIRAGGRTP